MKIATCKNFQGNEKCSLYCIDCDKVKNCSQKDLKKQKQSLEKGIRCNDESL